MAESQTTLVDRPHGAVHLILSKDNSFNTTMTLDDKPVYRLESTTHLTTTTHIFHVLASGEKELYMTYKRRPVGSVFEKPDGEKTKASKIMRTHGPLLTKDPMINAPWEFGGTTYEWKIDMMGQVACFEQGGSLDHPVAWFNKSQRKVEDGKPVIHPASLNLAEKVSEGDIRDMMVLTWIPALEMGRSQDRVAMVA